MYLYRIIPDGTALKRWELCEQPLVVGRDREATVQIPDYRISGRHFAIAREGGAFILEDLGSKNGTWINGRRVTRTELKSEDRILAGRTHFSFEAGLATVIGQLECQMRDRQPPGEMCAVS
jgi:pSer/pThr/pTyr-binding forkhead associated (FHA) protein